MAASASAVLTSAANLRTSPVQVEASKYLSDERSISLRKVFDVPLAREQVAEQNHVQEVAWFGEQCSILNSRRAAQKQRLAEQASTGVVTVEQILEACKTKLHLSEVHEQEQLEIIANLKQEVEQTETDGSALLQERSAHELTCIAAQDRLLALWAKHGQTVDEFGTRLSDVPLAIAETNDLADASVAHSTAVQTELREVQEAAPHFQTYIARVLKVAHEYIDRLKASIITTDVKNDELRQINVLTEAELPALGEDVDTFEALAVKVEAQNDAVESLLIRDKAEDNLWRGVLSAERDKVLDE